MQCPKCNGFGACYSTKSHGDTKQRYRKCQKCGHRWSSWEEREDRAIRAYGAASAKPDDRQQRLFQD